MFLTLILLVLFFSKAFLNTETSTPLYRKYSIFFNKHIYHSARSAGTLRDFNSGFKGVYKAFLEAKTPSLLNYLHFTGIFTIFLDYLSSFMPSRELDRYLLDRGFVIFLSKLFILDRGECDVSLYQKKKTDPIVNFIVGTRVLGKVWFAKRTMPKKRFGLMLADRYPTISKYVREDQSNLVGQNLFYSRWISNSVKDLFLSSRTSDRRNLISISNSSINKFLEIGNLSRFDMLFLRKSKVFNKGRYSRNRQFYRTGVYWCLYLSIILFTGLYYWFYHFIINFGFLWWLFFLLISSFVVPKSIKYRFYNPSKLTKGVGDSIFWLLLQIKSIFIFVHRKIRKIFVGTYLAPLAGSRFDQNFLSDIYNAYFFWPVENYLNFSSTRFAGNVNRGKIINECRDASRGHILDWFHQSLNIFFFGIFGSSIATRPSTDREFLVLSGSRVYDNIFPFVSRINFISIGRRCLVNTGRPTRRGIALNIVAALLLTPLILVLFLYIFVIISYECSAVVPSIINFDLVGTSVFFFSLLSAEVLTESSLVHFLGLLARSSYNNPDNVVGGVKIQEKYFLKHESDFFSDKKFSDSRLDGLYLPGDNIFYTRFLDKDLLSRNIADKSILDFLQSNLSKNIERSLYEQGRHSLLSGQGLYNPGLQKHINDLLNYLSLETSTIGSSCITQDLSHNCGLEPGLNCWYSKLMFSRNITNGPMLGGEDCVFFFKCQANMNKYFIEKNLYMFSGTNWVYYYFLPRSYQSILDFYSTFISWVLSDSSSHDFSENKSQINKLIEVSQLAEIELPKLIKKF